MHDGTRLSDVCLVYANQKLLVSLSYFPPYFRTLYNAPFLQRIISKKNILFPLFFLDNSARNGHPSACAKRRGRSIGGARKLGENPCCRRKESTREKSDGGKVLVLPSSARQHPFPFSDILVLGEGGNVCEGGGRKYFALSFIPRWVESVRS